MKTKVYFLNEKDGNGVFAFFPEEKFNNEPGNFTCYAHVGQHGACNIDYAKECKEALFTEYYDLLRELMSIGYKLEILNSQTITAHRKPTEAEIKRGYGATHYRDFTIGEIGISKRNGMFNMRFKAKDDKLIYSTR